MPTTELDVDVDSVVLDDLDFEIVCEVQIWESFFGMPVRPRDPRCERPAQWVILCLKCRMAAFSCDEHLRESFALPRIQCMACRAMGAPRDLFRWFPLDGPR